MIKAINGYYDQLVGPFFKNQEIVNIIKEQSCLSHKLYYIQALGIQGPEHTKVNINGKPFIIGKTKILELRNVEITSIIFPEDTDNNVCLDYIII